MHIRIAVVFKRLTAMEYCFVKIFLLKVADGKKRINVLLTQGEVTVPRQQIWYLFNNSCGFFSFSRAVKCVGQLEPDTIVAGFKVQRLVCSNRRLPNASQAHEVFSPDRGRP